MKYSIKSMGNPKWKQEIKIANSELHAGVGGVQSYL